MNWNRDRSGSYTYKLYTMEPDTNNSWSLYSSVFYVMTGTWKQCEQEVELLMNPIPVTPTPTAKVTKKPVEIEPEYSDKEVMEDFRRWFIGIDRDRTSLTARAWQKEYLSEVENKKWIQFSWK